MNKKVEGHLVMDISEKIVGYEEAFQLTATKKDLNPVARNIFVLKRLEAVDGFGNNDILHYGQKVKIEANPYYYKKSLYLDSQ